MRRRVSRVRREEEESVDLTPLIDVVFIMLIFFICTTSFVRESGVEITRPSAETGEAQSDSGVIFIGLDAAERIWVDNTPVDIRMVRPRLEQLKLDTTDSRVVIQSDKAVATGMLVRVMDQVRQAGISQIAVATKAEAS